MKSLALKILFILYFIGANHLSAQILTNNSNGSNSKVDLKFYFDKIETKSQSVVFNILSIKNNSVATFSGSVQFSIPRSWSFISEDQVPVSIDAGDSVSIPLRVVVSSSALGEIGYSLVASLRNSEDRNVTTEYCYITIPRESNFEAKSTERIVYVSKNRTETSFNYNINNQGNINELVHLQLSPSEALILEDQNSENISIKEYSLPPYTDSTLNFKVKLKKTELQLSRIEISSSSLDTSFLHTIWFKMLDDIYKLNIPELNKCLIVELSAHNIFSSESASYSLMAKGSILFKNGFDFYYYFRNYNLSNIDENQKFKAYSKYYIGVKNRFGEIRLGSIERSLEQSMYGIGIDARINFKKHRFEAIYVEDTYGNYTTYGGEIILGLSPLDLSIGAAQSIYTNSINSNLLYGGVSFNILKNSQINLRTGISETNSDLFDKKEGYGLNFRYKLVLKKFKFYLNSNYGSPNYTGVYRGRFFAQANTKYSINEKTSIEGQFQKQDYNRAFFLDSPIDSLYFSSFNHYTLYLYKILENSVHFQVGGIFKTEISDQFYPLGSGETFNTYNSRFFIAAQLKSRNNLYVAPRFDIGLVNLSPAESDFQDTRKIYTTMNASININKSNLGLYTLFRYGPYTLYEHYYYYQNGTFSKWFFVMPYYWKYFFNDQIKIDLRGNYINNITNNENTLTLNSQLIWFLPHDLSFRFLNAVSFRSRADANTNQTYRYTSLYFEMGLRKEFSCKQPRIKYYDLKVVFFRDLNGDRKKNQNEPGINNVYANIVRNSNTDLNIQDNGFIDGELLSDQNGEIQYQNIPNGEYSIVYNLLGEQIGNFSLLEMEQYVTMDKDKIVYIPYQENNKIYGRIELIRDPLSSFGSIDISNIRIIAEDTQGRTYSALTDQTGHFVLYTPKADYYIVKINNIFYESFDLQQSEFIVKFNGYKQFEVTFVFEEKKRKINFDNNASIDDIKIDEIQTIRKTTLSGKIRDAISLEPVDAKIEIIDNKTGKKISDAISNKLNGNYSISYVAGDNFRIEVKANGYWDHVENLYIEQVISIQNIAKDIMLNKTSDGPKKQTFIIYDEKEEEQFTENFKSGQKIPMNNLNFDEKETRLSPNAYPELDRLIDILEKNKSVRIEIAGHADDSGKERIDNLLALRRAKAVARYLTSHSLDESRIEVKSYSNKRPLVPGNSEKAKQRNRRVEITVL